MEYISIVRPTLLSDVQAKIKMPLDNKEYNMI
jgi:hypothetical protein